MHQQLMPIKDMQFFFIEELYPIETVQIELLFIFLKVFRTALSCVNTIFSH
jgi:hypothetical protein